MKIIHHLTIDMARRLPDAPLAAVQNDSNTRYVEITLLENGKNWEVPDGITAAVAFRKPDGHNGLYDQLPNGDAAVAINGSAVFAILAPQVLACAGEVKAAVVFHDTALNQLATFPFTIRVAANPAAGQSVSNDYYRYSTMEEVSEAVEAALVALETEKQEFLDKAEAALADVRNALEASTPAIVCEASGEVISAADASDRPLKGLSIYGKTVQNGTPTPENPVPLESVGADGAIRVTVAGKNLFGGIALADKLVEVASSTKDISAGTVTISGANVAHNPMLFDGAFKENTQYTIVLYGRNNVETGDATNLNIFYTDGTNEDIRFPKVSGDRYVVHTTMTGKTVSHIYCRYQSGISILYYDQCGIFEGVLTEADYEPYKGQTLTASTPNGLHGIDSVKDEIDFARGVRVQRLGTVVFDGSADEPWNYANSYIDYPNSSTLYARIWMPLSAIGGAPDSLVLCDKLGNYGVGLNYAPKHGAELWTNNANFHVLPGKDYLYSENSIETMRKWLADNPITVLYVLATPIETPLSAEELAQYAALHSNKPNTTVFNDANAGMKLAYVADTKNYIDQKLAAISAAILNA